MDEFFDKLFIRILLLVVTVAVIGGLLSLLLFFNTLVPAEILRWIVVIALGLLAGLASRGLLPVHARRLRWVSALVALCAGFGVTGWVTQGYVGFSPLTASTPSETLIGLIHLLLAGVIAWMAVRVWPPATTPVMGSSKNKKTKIKKKPQTRSKVIPTGSVKRSTRITQPGAGRGDPGGKKPTTKIKRKPKSITSPSSGSGKRPSPTLSLSRVNISTKDLSKGMKAGWKRVSHNARSVFEKGRAGVVQLAAKMPEALKTSSVHLEKEQADIAVKKRSAKNVHLGDGVEHRCPYCLEVVNVHDPRGVKVCPICHTHHHADCWAVTGVCQVPHLNKG